MLIIVTPISTNIVKQQIDVNFYKLNCRILYVIRSLQLSNSQLLVLENGSQEEVRVESGMWPQQLLLLQQSMNYLRLDQSFYQLLKLNFYPIFKLIFDPNRFHFQVEQLVYNSYNSSCSRRVLQQQCLTQIIQMVKKQILKFGQQFQQLEPEEYQKSSIKNTLSQQREVIKTALYQITK
ncbi:Hypothetical_protein [Hexamita inflata]|uniref:Hypothetical_protein n=1 Tax=Hexamita inflata TaxID=28002 RepID=A0ABP1L0Y7_9EUKA